MKKATFNIILAVLALIAVSCNKTVEQRKQPVPPGPVALTKGVSANINNTKWIADGRTSQDSTSTSPTDSTTTQAKPFYAFFEGPDSSSIGLVAAGSFTGFENANWAKIYLTVKGFTGEGNYPLGQNDGGSSAIFTVGYQDVLFNQFSTGSDATGTVIISTYNKANNTISGSFEFTAKSTQSGDNSSIVVNNGQFIDIPLQ